MRLRFANSKYHVDFDMLNKEYGDKGMTFSSFIKARNYHKDHPRTRLIRLTDHCPKDILRVFDKNDRCIGYEIADGAVKKTKGWLVTPL